MTLYDKVSVTYSVEWMLQMRGFITNRFPIAIYLLESVETTHDV